MVTKHGQLQNQWSNKLTATPDFSKWLQTYPGKTKLMTTLYKELPRISKVVKERRLKLAGHLIRHDNIMEHKLVLWEPINGLRWRQYKWDEDDDVGQRCLEWLGKKEFRARHK